MPFAVSVSLSLTSQPPPGAHRAVDVGRIEALGILRSGRMGGVSTMKDASQGWGRLLRCTALDYRRIRSRERRRVSSDEG